jgi:hypothetical protein
MRRCIYPRFLWNIVLLLGTVAAGRAGAEDLDHYALIIANEAYTDQVGRLYNTHKDAEVIRDALIAVGFPRGNIEIVRDASRGQILATVGRHAARLTGSASKGLGFFYYSGHGAAKPNTNKNYLIPVSVKDAASVELWDEAVSLDEIHDRLQEYAPEAAHIVVFDACRNELQLPQRGGSKGFLPVQQWGGMLIAYSTAPGQTASDGDRNAPAGPYATVLAQELRSARNMTASELFARVRSKAKALVAGQEPWFSYGLDATVRFGPEAITERCTAEQASRAREIWEKIQTSTYPAYFRDLIQRYPGCVHAEIAATRLRELEEQQRQARDTPDRLNITGHWADALSTSETVQSGNTFNFTVQGTSCIGSYNATANGKIDGKHFTSTYEATSISQLGTGSRGRCSGEITMNGVHIEMDCTDSRCGAFHSSANRQQE